MIEHLKVSCSVVFAVCPQADFPAVAQQILDLFPLPELPPKQAIASNLDEIEDRIREVQKSLLLQKPAAIYGDEDSDSPARPGELYRRYRKVEDLSSNAKFFFERAGELSWLFRVEDKY